jgi:endonuclease YncB( thermonuclease family)
MATILVPSRGHIQEQSMKILSITNRQQLLVEVEQHGRAVHLACLQAPRFRQEPWAEFAQSGLESHVKRGDQASFELRSRDVYGRLVGRLFANGKDLGAQFVRQGSVMAWDGFVGCCDDLNYIELEQLANDLGLGLWSASPPLERPWDVIDRR